MASRKISLLIPLALLAFVPLAAQTNTCETFNQTSGPFFQNRFDKTGHSTGAHADGQENDGKCSYTPVGGFPPCITQSQTSVGTPTMSDIGSLTGSGFHVGFNTLKDGNAVSTGGLPATSDGESAVAFTQCPVSDCSATIGMTGGGEGGGFSVQWPNSTIWSDTFYLKMNCGGILKGGGGTGCNGVKGGDKNQTHHVCEPIVADTAGIGFHHFTNPQTACVLFDLHDDGKPVCLSWPEPGSGLAWLALPGEDGVVRNGKQFFSNITLQEHHLVKNGDCGIFPCRNGFSALAEWDLPFKPYDGNSDMLIDQRDAIWPRLRLWIDDHCYLHPQEVCVSLPGELHRLDEFGVHNISLAYGYDPQNLDQWGNQFRLYTHINVEPPSEANPGSRQESKDGRLIYDVYLVEKQE
jgi:hypothetical protein